jgi:hypothetical protein
MAHIDIINHLDRSFQYECGILSMIHKTSSLVTFKPKSMITDPSLVSLYEYIPSAMNSLFEWNYMPNQQQSIRNRCKIDILASILQTANGGAKRAKIIRENYSLIRYIIFLWYRFTEIR